MYVSLERGLCLALSNLTHLCVSFFYRSDERFDAAPKDYPFQDDVDPLSSRFSLYVNAKDCALEWIEEAARRAPEAGKSALFFMFHATFYQKNGVMLITSGAIGNYYNANNLTRMTRQIGNEVKSPNAPLFEALSKVAFEYKDLLFEVVHSDAHKFCRRGCCPKSTIIEPTFAVITT